MVFTFGAALTIVLNILLIPRFGYYGSAWATLVVYTAMVVLSYLYGQRHYPVPYQIGRIATYTGLALLFVAIEIYVLSAYTDYWVYLVRIVLILAYMLFGWWREKPFKSVT